MYTISHMETLVLDGKSYVKASKAARDLGYATDYVGQLCRSGKVTAHLIGRTWYVNPDELSSHRVEKKRMSRVKAREQAHKSIEEHRTKVAKEPKVYKNIEIQYEQDSNELIPQTKKLKVQQSVIQSNDADQDLDMHPEILNEGEKVQMSGKISVEDLNDGVADSETTTLTPTVMHSQAGTPSVESLFKTAPAEAEAVKEEPVIEAAHTAIDFNTKLAAHNVSLESLTELNSEVRVEQSSITAVEESIAKIQTAGSIIPYVLVTFSILLVSTISIFFSLSLVYTNEGVPNIETAYNFSLDKTLSLLRLKI